MGAWCDTMKQASNDVWRWFFPEKQELPECVLELLKVVFPTVDWDKVDFYKGIPHVLSTGQDAITLPDTYNLSGIGIYFDPASWNPCSEDGLAIFIHEGVHVLQIQQTLNGYGLGFARPFIMNYLSCWVANGFDYETHPMELAAYRVAACNSASAGNRPACPTISLFEDCYDESNPICECSSGEPVLNQTNLDSFAADCTDVVQNSTGSSFLESSIDCVPGLRKIFDTAKALLENCKKVGRVDANEVTSTISANNDRTVIIDDVKKSTDKLAQKVFGQWVKCVWSFIGAILLYIIGAIYYALWMLLAFIVSVIIWVLKIIFEIIGVIIAGIMWIVTGIVCAVEWLIKKIRDALIAACDWSENLQRRCAEWEETRTRECAEEEDRGYSECAEEEDRGYNECSRREDQGYNECCDWAPCSWFCKAWVWVSNVVCVAWTWVSNIVCVAWTWVSNIVCVAWTWVVSRSCKAFTWVVSGLTCWAR